MLQEIIARFMAYIVDDLVRIFQMGRKDAKLAVKHSCWKMIRIWSCTIPLKRGTTIFIMNSVEITE